MLTVDDENKPAVEIELPAALSVVSEWTVLCVYDLPFCTQCCCFALGITDDGIALGGAKPDQHFSDDFNKPFVPKVAKEMLTYNRRPIDSHDPCEKKQCSPGYTCKAVVNRYLLQVSVAICIPNSVADIGNVSASYSCISTIVFT